MGSSAVLVEHAFEDPAGVRRLIESAGPFWPIANYAASDAEMAALGSRRVSFTPPWFRQDFALLGEARVPGSDAILTNARFTAAAAEIYGGAAVVRPTTVYVNVMGPTPFPFPPHLDVPAFRGFTRADYPIWLLKVMHTSGLFEQWRTRIATAVSWFYEGVGGDFHYWPDGPAAPQAKVSPPFRNVAVVADNEATFHGVAALGTPDATMPEGLDREASLVRGTDGWDIVNGGSVIARIADGDARITISWKADVFADESEAAAVDSGEHDLDMETIVSTFLADLASRGEAVTRPVDPLYEPEWVATLGRVYRDRAPRIQ